MDNSAKLKRHSFNNAVPVTYVEHILDFTAIASLISLTVFQPFKAETAVLQL